MEFQAHSNWPRMPARELRPLKAKTLFPAQVAHPLGDGNLSGAEVHHGEESGEGCRTEPCDASLPGGDLAKSLSNSVGRDIHETVHFDSCVQGLRFKDAKAAWAWARRGRICGPPQGVSSTPRKGDSAAPFNHALRGRQAIFLECPEQPGVGA